MAKKESAQPEQRYACDRPGCDKSYSRPDHLLRHKLNHDVDRVLCCNQCDRTFVRQDLLVRHLERHALRGKTLGRWSNKTKDKEQSASAKRSGAGGSRTKTARRGSKAVKTSHEANESDTELLDPGSTSYISDAGMVGLDDEHEDKDGAVASGAFSRYPGPSTYSDLPEPGPSPSTWGGSFAGHPSDLPPGPHAAVGQSSAVTDYPPPPPQPPQPQQPPHWSPPAASASSVSAMSPPFRRTRTTPFATYSAGPRDGGEPSPSVLLGFEGSHPGRGSISSGAGAVGPGGGRHDPPEGRGAAAGGNGANGSGYDGLGGRNAPPPWHHGGGFSGEVDSSGRTMDDATMETPDNPASFRWMGPDDLSGDGGADRLAAGLGGPAAGGAGHGHEAAGSYAPPPSGAYYAGWPDNDAAVAGSAHRSVGGSGGAVEASGDAASAAVVGSRSAALAMPLTANQDIFPFAPPAVDHTADYGWLFDGMDPFGSSGFPGFGRFGASRGQSQASGFSPSSSDGLGGFLGSLGGGSQNGGNGNGGGGSRHGGGDTASFGRGMSSDGFLLSGSEADVPNALEDLAYFASLQAEIPSKVTYNVDPVAHQRLLVFLSSVSELPSSPLFTASALRCYIYLFFSKFNRLYPLIHEPTFAASSTDPMLLSAVVVIGAHFAALPAHELAVRIAQKIWGAIVSLEDFRPARATLPMLQAMVLTECFGKMMSSRPQHEMSHLFHNFIITLARRNAVFNPSAAAASANPGSFEGTDEFWRSWAREEEKKRIALFAFMLDAQHATTFRHVPALSAFQIQLNLPCSDAEWSKSSPEAWAQHRKRTNYKPPTPFIPALKACLSPGKTPQELDAFPRFVLLHGLMSIAYDLHWKQNILLGAEGGPFAAGRAGADGGGIGNWKDRLSAAYSSLQARMDIAFIKAEDDSSTRLVHRATPSLVSAAQITLFADTIDIQIYAGLPSVLGRFIDRATFNASRRSVKEWAKTSDGTTAVWHAVNFLKTSLLGSGTEAFGAIHSWRPGHGYAGAEEEYRGRESVGGTVAAGGSGKKSSDHETGLDEVLHHRWCQYLCALVIWAYGHALATPRNSEPTTAANTRPSTSTARAGNVPDAPFPLQGPYPGPSRRSAAAGIGGGAPPLLKPEAVDFLERMSTKTPDGIASVDCKCYTKSVLELVEKELRGSRWELGREASGVLRKLIQNHALPHWDRSDAGGAGSSSYSKGHNSQGRNSNEDGGYDGSGGGGSRGNGTGDGNGNGASDWGNKGRPGGAKGSVGLDETGRSPGSKDGPAGKGQFVGSEEGGDDERGTATGAAPARAPLLAKGRVERGSDGSTADGVGRSSDVGQSLLNDEEALLSVAKGGEPHTRSGGDAAEAWVLAPPRNDSGGDGGAMQDSREVLQATDETRQPQQSQSQPQPQQQSQQQPPPQPQPPRIVNGVVWSSRSTASTGASASFTSSPKTLRA
ncbi:hypothetical protein ACQY0O_008131 [Thecaphora frezii]